MALVDINKRCNAQNRVGPEPDWRPIEYRIKSWVPTVQAAPSDETWKSSARLAVHESWRHTLLIYLYMGVCGAKSDDPRVQASVRQVFQLTNSVKGFENPSIDLHFLAQYLISPDTIFYGYDHRQAYVLAAKRIAKRLGKDSPLLLTMGSGSSVGPNLYPCLTTFGTAPLQTADQSTGAIMFTRDRRKKCDKARPICERCTVGGFVCLGYDNLDVDSPSSSLEESPNVSETVEKTQSYAYSQNLPTLFPDATAAPSPTWSQDLDMSTSAEGSDVPELGGLLNSDTLCFAAHSSHNGLVGPYFYTAPVDASESQSLSLRSTPTRAPQSLGPWRAKNNPRRSLWPPSKTNVPRLIDARSSPSYPSLPRELPHVSPDVGNMINFILSQHERLIDFSFFKPTTRQVLNIRESANRRIQTSDTVLWIMFLGSKILESILDGTSAQKMGGYVRWIAKFEKQLDQAAQSLITSGSQGHLIGTLELAFLKLKYYDGLNAYEVLRSLAPVFLQLVFADSTLWPSSYTFTVSLAHIYASPRYELGHFIFLDSLCSMVYALPQVIEYDTSISPLDSDVHPLEWAHGCPTVFQIALIEINARYNGPNQAKPETDWRPIERCIKSWQPTVQAPPKEESWRAVARLAGVYGATSGDARVQTSVRQLFQLFQLASTIKNSEMPFIQLHFLPQYIVAGICARTENQRTVVREFLEGIGNYSLWLLEAPEFVPVFDHLWHGVAANGQPVRWSDYAHSRQVALPINV
ncbi:hypothetical protein FRC06_001210 [Ceratobasidium sp. 370]|nr:hypothetical protein FRC06_001210 [Ceratobasidium sp. 370]